MRSLALVLAAALLLTAWLDSATVTDLVVSDGYLYARCRITGTSTPLTWASAAARKPA